MFNLINLWNQFLNGLPNIIAAILILVFAFLSALIAKLIVKNLMKLFKIDVAFEKAGLDEEKREKTKEFIGKLAYLIIFILWMPGFFGKLGLDGVATPIISMMNNILSYAPNIIGAILLLVVGLFIAKTVKELVLPILKKLPIDKYMKKAGVESKETNSIAEVLANFIYVIIVIPIIIGALNVLKIDAISTPATEMLNIILAYIPKVALALVIFFVGNFIAKLAFALLEKVLLSAGLDRVSDKVFEGSGTKVSKDLSLSKVVAYIVKYVIIVFFLVQAFNVIELDILTNIGSAIIGYLPYAVSGIIMLGIAVLLANYVQKLMLKSFPDSKVTAMIVKILIIAVGVFITLYQLGIATALINSAFIIILGAIAVAFAISFGIGGREFASNMLKRAEKTIDDKMKK